MNGNIDLGFSEVDPDAYSNSVFEQASKKIKMVYIDLPFMQDIYLGSLMCMCGTQEKYDYIYSQLDAYNERYVLDTAKYFPDLNVTNKEIMEFMKDSKNTKLLTTISPTTDLFLELSSFNIKLLENNSRFEKSHTKEHKVKYVINTYPLVLNDEEKSILKSRMQYIDEDISLGVMSIPCNELSSTFIANTDIFFIYDCGTFIHPARLSNGTKGVFDLMCRQNRFVGKFIYTPKFFYYKKTIKELEFLSTEDIEKSVKFNETLMSMYCDMVFRTPKILKGD